MNIYYNVYNILYYLLLSRESYIFVIGLDDVSDWPASVHSSLMPNISMLDFLILDISSDLVSCSTSFQLPPVAS